LSLENSLDTIPPTSSVMYVQLSLTSILNDWRRQRLNNSQFYQKHRRHFSCLLWLPELVACSFARPEESLCGAKASSSTPLQSPLLLSKVQPAIWSIMLELSQNLQLQSFCVTLHTSPLCSELILWIGTYGSLHFLGSSLPLSPMSYESFLFGDIREVFNLFLLWILTVNFRLDGQMDILVIFILCWWFFLTHKHLFNKPSIPYTSIHFPLVNERLRKWGDTNKWHTIDTFVLIVLQVEDTIKMVLLLQSSNAG
jgi:hypothetical protein